MGFLKSLVTGTPNTFQATAPNAGPQGDYAQAIRQAQLAAMAANERANQTGIQQGNLAQTLTQQANGQGPSLAQALLQQQTNQNMNQAASLLGSQRGINPALAQRLISQNQANIAQQAAGQGGIMRLQEQMGAREQLGQLLASQRAGDIGQVGANTGIFGTAGQLQGGQNALNQQGQLAAMGMNAQAASDNARFQSGVIGGLLGGGGAALGSWLGRGSGGGGAGGGGVPSFQSPVMYAAGGPIPGSAPVAGDSPSNDTVPAMLSPGEIVIPRSVAQSEDAPERAAEFVKAIKNKKGDSGGYGALLAKQRELHERMKRLEAMAYGGAVPGCT